MKQSGGFRTAQKAKLQPMPASGSPDVAVGLEEQGSAKPHVEAFPDHPAVADLDRRTVFVAEVQTSQIGAGHEELGLALLVEGVAEEVGGDTSAEEPAGFVLAGSILADDRRVGARRGWRRRPSDTRGPWRGCGTG